MDVVDVVTENRSSQSRAREAMLDVRGGAVVTCGDGTRVGTLAGLVTTSPVPHVTALVVRDVDSGRPWHPVPLAGVGAATPDGIDVTVTRRDLRRRTFPTRVVVIDDVRHDLLDGLELGGLPGMWMPPEPPLRIPVSVPRLEPGEVLIAVGVPVYADGQRIGRLRGMRADHATGRVTSLIADTGHRWRSHLVLVPAQAIDELSEAMVWLRATREDVLRMPSADERRQQPYALIPAEPHEVGVAESEPDSAHVEAARVLADEARDALVPRGFSDAEIRHWAEAYCREQRSGDVETFLGWIDLREHQS